MDTNVNELGKTDPVTFKIDASKALSPVLSKLANMELVC